MVEKLTKDSSQKMKEIIANYKKNESKISRIALITFLMILAYVSLILGSFSFIKNNTIHWIIFALIPFLITTGLVSFKKISELLVDASIEQKQFAIINIVKTIILYCLFDCFYLSVFSDCKVWIYITGVLSVFFVLIDLVKGFLSNNEILSIKTFGLLFNMLVAIIITITFIYNIDNLELRNIVVPIVAAVYGGLITLLGVALSIKHNEKIRKKDREQLEQDRKEEIRIKERPLFTFRYISEPIDEIEDKSYCFFPTHTKSTKPENSFKMQGKLRNSDKCDFLINSILVGKTWLKARGNIIAMKGENLIFYYSLNEEYVTKYTIRKENAIYFCTILKITDVLNNPYFYSCTFVCDKEKYDNLFSLFELEETTDEDFIKKIEGLPYE